MLKYEIVLDPPINAKEFGDWNIDNKSDPNIELKDKHGYVTLTVECEAKESIEWFLNLLQDRIGDRMIEIEKYEY